MPDVVGCVASFARVSADWGHHFLDRRPLMGRSVRWRTAGGYATTATRTHSRHTDEVIVMMLDWNDYQRQLGTNSARVMDAYTAKTSEAKS